MAITADQVVVQLRAEVQQYQQNMRSAASAATQFDLKSSTALSHLDQSFSNLGKGAVQTGQEVTRVFDKMASAQGPQKLSNQLDELIRKQLEFGRMTAVVPQNLPGLGGASWGADPFKPIIAGAENATKSVKNMQFSLGNMAAQFNDIGVTAAMGMSPMLIALQQGTQLSQAFAGQKLGDVVKGLGASFASVVSPVSLVTIGLVAVASAAIQVATSFLMAGDKTESLEDQISDLQEAVSSYRDAVAAASAPTKELSDRYGIAASAAKRLLEGLQGLARIEAVQAIRESGKAVSDSLDGAIERLERFEDVAFKQGYGENDAAAVRAVRKLKEEYSLTIEQAQKLRDLIGDRSAARTPEEMATAMQRLADFLRQANAESGYTNENLIKAEKAATQAALAGYDLAESQRDAARAASDLSISIGGISFADAISGADALAGRISGMIGQARTLMSVLGQAAQRNMDAESRRELLQIEREGLEAGKSRAKIEGDIAAARERQKLDSADIFIPVALRDQQIEKARENAEAVQGEVDAITRLHKAAADAEKPSAGGRSKGGKGRQAREDRPLFEETEKSLLNLERQISLVGKSADEVAKARAQWALLDEATKRGIPITAELNAQIEAQASQVGRLTAELEKAEIAQQQFDQAIDGIADAFAGALVAGESLREGLGQVLKSIASDIINSGIRNALLSQFGGGGGLFGGLVQSFLGGGDRLTGALRVAGLPARASGGPVTAGQMYMTGERGPEPFVPAVNGRILSVSQAQAALRGGAQPGGSSMHIHVTAAFDESGNLYVKDVAEQAAMSMGAQINSALPARVQQINANPRRR